MGFGASVQHCMEAWVFAEVSEEKQGSAMAQARIAGHCWFWKLLWSVYDLGGCCHPSGCYLGWVLEPGFLGGSGQMLLYVQLHQGLCPSASPGTAHLAFPTLALFAASASSERLLRLILMH